VFHVPGATLLGDRDKHLGKHGSNNHRGNNYNDSDKD